MEVVLTMNIYTVMYFQVYFNNQKGLECKSNYKPYQLLLDLHAFQEEL